jgi:hypothetical protein
VAQGVKERCGNPPNIRILLFPVPVPYTALHCMEGVVPAFNNVSSRFANAKDPILRRRKAEPTVHNPNMPNM